MKYLEKRKVFKKILNYTSHSEKKRINRWKEIISLIVLEQAIS